MAVFDAIIRFVFLAEPTSPSIVLGDIVEENTKKLTFPSPGPSIFGLWNLYIRTGEMQAKLSPEEYLERSAMASIPLISSRFTDLWFTLFQERCDSVCQGHDHRFTGKSPREAFGIHIRLSCKCITGGSAVAKPLPGLTG